MKVKDIISKDNIERLLEFKILSDKNNSYLVEIRTTHRTYTDIWNCEISTIRNKYGKTDTRFNFSNNLKNYCLSHNINTYLYNHID